MSFLNIFFLNFFNIQQQIHNSPMDLSTKPRPLDIVAKVSQMHYKHVYLSDFVGNLRIWNMRTYRITHYDWSDRCVWLTLWKGPLQNGTMLYKLSLFMRLRDSGVELFLVVRKSPAVTRIEPRTLGLESKHLNHQAIQLHSNILV